MKKAILIVLIVMATFSVTQYVEKLYWRYWPFEPITVCPDKIKVENAGQTVMAGSMMIYTVTIDKKMPGACTVKRQLVNSYRIDYDPVTPPEKELGPQKVTTSIHVPQSADSGEWFMRWTVECPTGGPDGRMISMTRESEKFRVVSVMAKGPKGEQGKDGKPGKNFWGK